MVHLSFWLASVYLCILLGMSNHLFAYWNWKWVRPMNFSWKFNDFDYFSHKIWKSYNFWACLPIISINDWILSKIQKSKLFPLNFIVKQINDIEQLHSFHTHVAIRKHQQTNQYTVIAIKKKDYQCKRKTNRFVFCHLTSRRINLEFFVCFVKKAKFYIDF